MEEAGIVRANFLKKRPVVLPDFNCVDHVRETIMQRIDEDDLSLLPGLEFEELPPNNDNDSLRCFQGRSVIRRFLNHETGLLVMILDDRTHVKFSPARMLGRSNDRIREVSQEDLVRLVRNTARQLLPRTTAAAHRRGFRWGVVEISLAIDLYVDPASYLKSYKHFSWGGSRRRALCRDNSVTWSSKDDNLRLVAYDKGEEMQNKRKSKSKSKSKSGGPAPGTTLRVEVTFRGHRQIERLLRFAAQDSVSVLPFLFGKDSKGKATVTSLPITFPGLHAGLARELGRVGDHCGTKLSGPDEALFKTFEMFPRAEVRFLENLESSPGAVRRYWRKKVQCQLELKGIAPLIEAAYGEESAALRNERKLTRRPSRRSSAPCHKGSGNLGRELRAPRKKRIGA